MSEPKTLLQMAGAPTAPPPLGDAALVVIDAQREYLDGALILTGVEGALANIAALLEAGRAAGATVLHVAHRGKAGGLFDRDAENGAIAEQATPADDEIVIEKSLPNAFAGTELHRHLSEAGRTKLIVAGFMTHMCISSTVRAALDLGYQSTVVGDAAATRALPNPLGGPALNADSLHHAALAALADRFAVITTTKALTR